MIKYVNFLFLFWKERNLSFIALENPESELRGTITPWTFLFGKAKKSSKPLFALLSFKTLPSPPNQQLNHKAISKTYFIMYQKEQKLLADDTYISFYKYGNVDGGITNVQLLFYETEWYLSRSFSHQTQLSSSISSFFQMYELQETIKSV